MTKIPKINVLQCLQCVRKSRRKKKGRHAVGGELLCTRWDPRGLTALKLDRSPEDAPWFTAHFLKKKKKKKKKNGHEITEFPFFKVLIDPRWEGSKVPHQKSKDFL